MPDLGRDDLIEEVKYGRMTPADAEAAAARLGLSPLASVPDGAKFNPMGEAWWSLTMTVAWIAWRDLKMVREYWDTYRRECFDWLYRDWRIGFDGPVHAGHFLEARRPATLVLMSLAHHYQIATDQPAQSSMRVDTAIDLLWHALQGNSIQGTGIPVDGEKRATIPDCEWRDLKPIEERGRDVIRYGGLSNNGYNDISFRSHVVRALWPEIRLSNERLELPANVQPDGPGYFPLYCAAQWIATQGGILRFNPTGTTVWRAAFSELTAHIASGHVSVTGVRNGIREKVEGYIFASIQVDFPFVDTPLEMILTDEVHLRSYAYVDDEHWHKGFDDSLQTGAGIQWSKLMVLKSEVAHIWPFPAEDASSVNHRTGAPGRPTPIHLVVSEHRRRLSDGNAVESVTVEARHLADWLRAKYPEMPPLQSKTIENKIRADHRKAKETPRK